jgi:transcriptional regulator with XRE-family HTH domain
MTTRTERLRQLMAEHHLNAAQVAEMLDRSHTTVRMWACKNPARNIPKDTLELLESKLKNHKKVAK